MKTVFSLFTDYQDAEEAVDRLLERGFDPEDMNVIVQESTADNSMDVNQRTADVQMTAEFGEQTLFGLDRILAGRQPVATTEIGKVRAAGNIASMITRTAVAPGSSMEFEEVLQDFGLKEADAQAYLNGLREGDLLFFIRSDQDRLSEVYNLLSQCKARHVSSNQA
jgi:hypothetical protein